MTTYYDRLLAAGERNTDPHSTEDGYECGQWAYGERQLCAECTRWYSAVFVQGWAYYPGDTCEHGVYVGGCGVDWMCMECELGDPEEGDDDDA